MKSTLRAMQDQLNTLVSLLSKLDNETYCYPSEWLSGATIGQHSRHVIELLQCLIGGYNEGTVCYDKRKRDQQLETNTASAVKIIDNLLLEIGLEDKPLYIGYILEGQNETMAFAHTSFQRELLYNIEHAIHHLALIKVALKELNIANDDENFGVAYATIQYRKTCAQ